MNVFPGMAHFMEDDTASTSTEVDVQVVVESEQAAEEAEAVVETAEEVEEVAEQAEMAFQSMERAEFLHSYIAKNGINRHFLELIDHDKKFSSHLNIDFPATESFSEIGSPSSEHSVAAMEGLKEMAGKAWDFIRRIAAAVMKAVRNFITAIMTRITSYEATVKRFEAAFKDAKWDAEKIKDKKASLVSAAEVAKLTDALEASKADFAFIGKHGGSVSEEDFAKVSAVAEKIKARIGKDADLTVKEDKLTTLWSESERGKITANIRSAIAGIRSVKEHAADFEAKAKQLEATAKSHASMNADSDEAKKDLANARRAARVLNMAASISTKLAAAWGKVASYNARAGSVWLSCRA